MLASAAKPYYLAPAYTVLLAGGAAEVARRSEGRPWVRAAILAVVVALGAALAPLAVPILPVETYVRYAAALGQAPGTDERHAVGRLPQFFADMHGWLEFAGAMSVAYHSLPDEDRAVACIVGNNYGEAGAIDRFARTFDLPPAISTHNSYFLWGPRDCTGAVILIASKSPERLARLFASVEARGLLECGDCMPYENGQTIWVARGPRTPLPELWPALKHYE